MGGIRRLTPREALTTIHALAVMTAVELTVRWIPLPRLSKTLGVTLRLGPDGPDYDGRPPDDLDERSLRQLACSRRLARVWPFADGPCLRRALTEGHLIRRLEPELRIGMIEDAEDLTAHAWLEIGGHPLEPVGHLRPFDTVPSLTHP